MKFGDSFGPGAIVYTSYTIVYTSYTIVYTSYTIVYTSYTIVYTSYTIVVRLKASDCRPVTIWINGQWQCERNAQNAPDVTSPIGLGLGVKRGQLAQHSN